MLMINEVILVKSGSFVEDLFSYQVELSRVESSLCAKFKRKYIIEIQHPTDTIN